MTRENSYAPLDADGLLPAEHMAAGTPATGDIPVVQGDGSIAYEAPGAAAHPNLATHDALGLATDAELGTHAADTTSVHGIADTSVLSLTSHDHDADYEAAGGIATHAGAADPHTGYLKEADFDDIDFLVGTATGHTGAEIVVGTSPGGELGGTWASPTVDATHSGSAHHDPVTVGTGLDLTGQLVDLDLSEVAAGGELGGFMDAPTVDATHSGSTHAATQAAAEATAASALSGHAVDADPHTGYVREADASWIDLTDGGATTLHSHAGGATGGTATLDFGAFPGATDASVDVIGQAAIVAGSLVEARLRLEATADHSADEHLVEAIKVAAGNIVAGTGFTIYGVSDSQFGQSTRLYGTWTVAWTWQ